MLLKRIILPESDGCRPTFRDIAPLTGTSIVQTEVTLSQKQGTIETTRSIRGGVVARDIQQATVKDITKILTAETTVLDMPHITALINSDTTVAGTIAMIPGGDTLIMIIMTIIMIIMVIIMIIIRAQITTIRMTTTSPGITMVPVAVAIVTVFGMVTALLNGQTGTNRDISGATKESHTEDPGEDMICAQYWTSVNGQLPVDVLKPPGGGGGEVPHGSQNPDPILDQHIWFFIPLFRPDPENLYP